MSKGVNLSSIMSGGGGGGGGGGSVIRIMFSVKGVQVIQA